MKGNKRLAFLLAILSVLVVIFVVRMTGGGNGGSISGGSSILTKKTETKPEPKREKLKIKNLEASNYTLRSIGQTPFDNPLLAKNDSSTKKPQGEINIPDRIPVTPPTLQRNEEPQKPTSPPLVGQGEQKNGMRLKALAQSGDKRVAVIDQGGKSVSAFVGSAVGSYIVTNITDSQVTLQNFNGTTVTLDLVS